MSFWTEGQRAVVDFTAEQEELDALVVAADASETLVSIIPLTDQQHKNLVGMNITQPQGWYATVNATTLVPALYRYGPPVPFSPGFYGPARGPQ